MKKSIVCLCLVSMLVGLVLTGCKRDSWLDWKAQNAAWLAQNRDKDSIQYTSTGLQYKVIRQGINGTRPDALKTVRVRYKGCLITGAVFEQNDDATFAVSSVVSGLQEGLKRMNKTGFYVFYIPQELAYGSEEKGDRKGSKNYIPPYSTLIFEVELIDVY